MFLNPQNIKNIYNLLRYKSHFLIKKITFLIQVDRDLYLLKDILYSLIFLKKSHSLFIYFPNLLY